MQLYHIVGVVVSALHRSLFSQPAVMLRAVKLATSILSVCRSVRPSHDAWRYCVKTNERMTAGCCRLHLL